jgi:hypothetical protein
MGRPQPSPSGLTKAPRKSHPVAPDEPQQPAPTAAAVAALPALPGDNATTLKQVTVRLPPPLVKAVKQAALDTDRTVQDVVAEALRAYLER